MSNVLVKAFACLALLFVLAAGSLPAFAQSSPVFTPGNLVVVVEGCGVHGGTCNSVANGTGDGSGNSTAGGYGDNQAAPLTVFQYAPNGTSSVSFVNSLTLPQSVTGANFPVSSEYGSSSEGSVQLSGDGKYLTLMGYGIDALSFNANPTTYGVPGGALAQSGSLTGQSYTPVPRVLALIDPFGNVDSSTAIFNIFNTNNPRSAAMVNGTSAYVSGQGADGDATAGVFLVPVGAITTSPAPITGLDAADASLNPISQDTRILQILNNTLYVSVDTKGGKNSARSFIGTLGTPPATSVFNSSLGPTQLTGFGTSKTGKLKITTGSNSNGNPLNVGANINLSPVNYFFASPTVLYVADSGFPKNDSNGDTNSTGTANIGNGGLQKWVNISGTWTLEYTLYQGLNLVNSGSASGNTGLFGLAGVVSGNNVLLYSTNYTITDLDPTYLYGITDTLSFTTATQAAGETFTVLEAAPPDSNFKGVTFAPTFPPVSVDVTTSPSGLSFTASGIGCAPGTYVTPATLSWIPYSTCTLTVVTPQSSGPGTQLVLAQWEDSSTSAAHTVTAPATSATYTATFTTQYQLTTAAGGGGSVSAGGFFDAGSTAVVTATPASGYYFVNFTGSTSSTSNPLSLVVNSPQSVTANFAAQSSQTITFTTTPPASAAFGSSFTVAASASSGLPVTFTSAGSCSNVGATYTITSGSGACSVIADQAGNVNYLAAPTVTLTANATKASQAITFTTTAPPSAPYNSTFTVAASASSGLPITYTSKGACTNSSATYTILVGTGICTVTASQPGDANTLAATPVSESTTATKATPSASLTGAPASAPFGSSFVVVASSTSPTPLLGITSSNPTACSLSGSGSPATVSILKSAGTCKFTAVWGGNLNYNPVGASQTTLVTKAASIVTWSAPAPITYGTPLDATQLNATANVPGAFTYAPPAGKIYNVGSYTLKVTFKPTDTNYSTVTATVPLMVVQASTTTAITSTSTTVSLNLSGVAVVTPHFSVTSYHPMGAVTLTASTGEVCSGTVTSSTGLGSCKLTFTTTGTRTVVASYGGDANHTGSDSSAQDPPVTVTVNPH